MPGMRSIFGAETPENPPTRRHAGRRRRACRRRRSTHIAVATLALFANSAFAAGDPVRGKALYGVCATCHGPNAEGMQEMNGAPLNL